MPAVIIKTTQSSQVARTLENRISSGHYRPGRKMPSTRELARGFDVSQQVVKSALDLLAQRNLIVREPRVGIFVNAQTISQHREYWLLASRGIDNPDITDYASQVLSVSNHDIWQDINLSTRLISSLTPDIVRYELDKIREIRPDCLLTQVYTKDSASLFAALPFPVVLIGDTDLELTGPPPPNQIVENTGERAAFMVQAAAEAGCRQVALVAGGDPDHSWGKKLKDGGEKAASEHGIDFRYVRHLTGGHDDTIRVILKETTADAVLIDGFRNIGSFIGKLNEAGHHPGQDLKIFANGEMHPGTIYIKSDYQAFSHAVLDRIDDLVKHPSVPFGRIELSGLIRRSLISLQ